MPTYTHICTDNTCNHEWESFYSIKADPPKVCPKCGKETAQRTIALSSKGIVELTGQELIAKLKQDGKDMQREAYQNETKYANIIGEKNYENIQTQLDRRRRR